MNTEPEIKVTKIGARWHARMFADGVVRDEMSCEISEDIGWICREMLRWHDKCGGVSAFASAARERQLTLPISRVWYHMI